MAKIFDLILSTTDVENVRTQETVRVRAGSPYFTPPDVSFAFPQQVSMREGSPTGPYWPTGEHWGFAYCRVVPTPSTDGSGRFFVQFYYNSGLFPNSPNFQFHDTFDGNATTLNGTLQVDSFNELAINAGGGISPYGFATSGDVSGLRRAMVITTDDLSYVYAGRQDANSPFQAGGERAGFRNPGSDELIAAYDHDQVNNKLKTLERLEYGYDSNNNRKTWTAGAQILHHPYHYVPLYQNEGGSSLEVMPYIAVIEEGLQFPLTGYFTVSGTSVSGTYTRLLSEVASGTQMAVRFAGNEVWYLVSGVTDNNQMVIWAYGSTPYQTGVSAEAIPYALGSGICTILPGLSGCADWDVALYPDYRNGDGVPNLSGVTFTANLLTIRPGGAPSGTVSYKWEVQPQGGAITTITNSGNQISVDFSTNVPKDVRVFVSGTGQAACIHSDSTGYITLTKSVYPGVWRVEAGFDTISSTTTETQGSSYWKIQGINTDNAAYFHHQLYAFEPNQADLNETWTTTNNYISVKKGQIDNWPATGTFICAYKQYTDRTRLIFGIYSGKQTSTTDDRLTGVSITGSFLIDRFHVLTSVGTGAGVATVPATTSTTFIYVPTICSWPFAFVDSRLSNTKVKLQGSLKLYARNKVGSKVYFLGGGSRGIHTNSIAGTSGNNFDEITFALALPSWVDNGAVCLLAPWDSNLTGNDEPNVASTYWNRGNQAFMYLNGLSYNATPTQQSTGGWIDTSNLFTLITTDKTKRTSTGTMANYPRYTWIPPQGKLVIPNIDRTKTLCVSYQSWTETAGSSDDAEVQFKNCRVVQSNGSPTSGYISGPWPIVQFKELKFNPSPYTRTYSGLLPNYLVKNPGIGLQLIGFNTMYVDVIRANQSATNPNEPGSEGIPAAQPNWEKALIQNFPANGIASQDPIYRPNGPAPSSSGDTGGDFGGQPGCVAGNTIVTILLEDLEEHKYKKSEVDLEIDEIQVGDLIKVIDKETLQPSWEEVLDFIEYTVTEVYQLKLESGRQIVITGTHPIATPLGWQVASTLKIGDPLICVNGVEHITEIQYFDDTQIDVYELTVSGSHAFVANGILVHNAKRQNPDDAI